MGVLAQHDLLANNWDPFSQKAAHYSRPRREENRSWTKCTYVDPACSLHWGSLHIPRLDPPLWNYII